MAISHKNGRVAARTVVGSDNKLQISEPKYDERGLIKGADTKDNVGQLIDTMVRDLDDAEDCRQITHTQNQTVDAFKYDQNNNVLFQEHHENNQLTNSSELVAKTAAGLPLERLNQSFAKIGKEPFVIKDKVAYDYYLGENIDLSSAKVERKIEGHVEQKDLPPEAKIDVTVNSNGAITSVSGAIQDNWRAFEHNSHNQIISKRTRDNKQNRYFYVEKKPSESSALVSFGDIQDNYRMAIAVANGTYNPPYVNMDMNQKAISSNYPSIAPAQYVVPDNTSFTNVAETLDLHGYAEVIAEENGRDVNDPITAGTTLKIPPLAAELPVTAWSTESFSQSNIVGTLVPDNVGMPTIWLPPPKVHHHLFEDILEAAVGIAVMIAAPELIPALGAALAVSGAVETALIYTALGAASGIASQSVGIALGQQKEFNWKAIAEGAILTGISAGVLKPSNALLSRAGATQNYMASGTGFSGYAKTILTAEKVALLQSAARTAIFGERFDWRSLGAAAASAGIGRYAGSELGLQNNAPIDSNKAALAAGFTSGVNTLTTDVAHGVNPFSQQGAYDLSVQTLGNMVGSRAASAAVDHYHVDESKQKD